MTFLIAQFLIGISMNLVWTPSPDQTVTGYNLYLGPSSHSYNQVFQVGNSSTYSLHALNPETTYYLAVTAYDDAGDESDYSDELAYTAPSKPLTLSIASLGGFGSKTTIGTSKMGVITSNCFEGGTFELDQTEDLASGQWLPIQTFVATSDVATTQIDLSKPSAFFRLRKLNDSLPIGVPAKKSATKGVPLLRIPVPESRLGRRLMPRHRLKFLFSYRGGMHASEFKKGAELLMQNSRSK